MKKETLEEATEKFATDCTLISDSAAFKGFIEGAKWQQEKLLSFDEEELVKSDNDKLLFQIGILRGMLRQREILYSEEEVGELVYNVIGQYGYHYGIMIDGAKLNELFEQFKKK